MGSLEEARRSYGEELRYVAHVQCEEVVRAFATVPRERFLGPGPWEIHSELAMTYWKTPDADPRHLYHNVLVAIDRQRRLNNGSPALWAMLFDALHPRPRERATHVGCGTGYYSAVLAEIVGPGGRVCAIEIDSGLAVRARENLAHRPWVEVIAGDGTKLETGPADVVVINAGATHPVLAWLEGLAPGGRMLLPLTVDGGAGFGGGGVLFIERRNGALAARFISRVGIFPCLGARDPELNRRLGEAFGRGMQAALAVQSLRTDPHTDEERCWLHAEDFCLSTRAPGQRPRPLC